MILTDLASMVLRIGELAFATVVAGLTGHWLHTVRHVENIGKGRFIYTEIIAGISILLSLLWLLPFSASFIHWPVDLFLSLAWFAAFGLTVDYLAGSCGATFDWSDNFGNGQCQNWKADEAFMFLSAIFWLASALLGLYWAHKHRTTKETVAHTGRRRAWYRSHRHTV